MKRADRVGARAAVIMGEDELSRSAVTVRDMRDGGQEEVALASLETYLARFS
jgi:histidyl-tRNA synthetase